MTNGEKLQELFPDLELEIYWEVVKAYEWKFHIVADKKWWNAEYKEPIKALEQEPTYVSELTQKAYEDGKKDGYVQAKIEQEPVLDKLRAEIERLQKMCDKNDLNLMAQYSAFGMVLDILDKYKVESEDKE